MLVSIAKEDIVSEDDLSFYAVRKSTEISEGTRRDKTTKYLGEAGERLYYAVPERELGMVTKELAERLKPGTGLTTMVVSTENLPESLLHNVDDILEEVAQDDS